VYDSVAVMPRRGCDLKSLVSYSAFAEVSLESVELAEGRFTVASNTSNRWTPEEEQRLKSLIDSNASFLLIAAKLKRTVQAVKNRAAKLRIRRPK
jgi:hypothetical protein